MQSAQLPDDETLRLASLQSCGILDTAPDPRFDALTRVAARVFGTSMAAVSLVDSDRQWFKSTIGLRQGGETHRDIAFCAHAILSPDRVLVIEDATQDPRFAANPLVTGPLGIRFYAGAPLRDRDGRALGTLCVMDTVPRQVSEEAISTLTDLAAGVTSVLELIRSGLELVESNDTYRCTIDLSPQIPWTADADGQIDQVGPRWAELTGQSRAETRGSGWAMAVHPQDLPATERLWADALRSGEPVDLEYRLRMLGGEYRWFRTYAAPRRDAGGRILRWYGTVEDIHARKLAEIALQESEAFARSVVDHSPDCIRVLDLQGRLLFMNEAGLRLMGVQDVAQVLGRRWDAVIPPENTEICEAALREAIAGDTARISVFGPNVDGQLKWWDVTVCAIPGADGRPARLLSIARDITAAKQAQEEVEQAHAAAAQSATRLSAVLESTTDSVLVLDRDWRITYLNQRAARMLSPSGLRLGDSIWGLFPESFDGTFHKFYRDAITLQTPTDFEAYSSVLEIWLEVHAFPTPDGLSIFFRDSSERRLIALERQEAEARLVHMARHDPLTGLANRAILQEELRLALSQARPQTTAAGADQGASPPQFALLCLDLDHFKAVNDTLGHLAGDALLKQVAERLSASVRDADTVARFGGDEFAILQTGLADDDSVAMLASRIIATVAGSYKIDGQEVNVGVSIGIAMAPQNGTDSEQIFRKADLALYRAKAENRGGFRFYDAEMDACLEKRQELKLSLRGAVGRGEFELFYQPLVDLHSGRVVSFEALLRWHHPTRGLVLPSEFIPVAEETSLVAAIGEWALRRACQEATQWPEETGIAVNLSPVQFRRQDLVKLVAEVLAETGLSATRLQLEITESVLLQHDDRNVATLYGLRDLGVRIVMDDFGTGYSSLAYLRSFPFHKIKIDKSFVSDLTDNAGSAEIVRSIVGLGRSLGIATTAEGVETREQLELLRLMGCGEVQGYYFSRPLPAHQALPLLDRPARELPDRQTAGVGDGAD
jgi:diguanylate cyclase (GGDEF)-like protein/PAS domain S-box-containing protein